MTTKPKVVLTSGKKKTAIARARIREGIGSIKINSRPLDSITPEMTREIILEVFQVAEPVLGKDFYSNLDIDVSISGGGINGQAYAARTAIGKALLAWTENEELRKTFAAYDRSLFVDDTRRKESKKYLRKGARAKPIKSYR